MHPKAARAGGTNAGVQAPGGPAGAARPGERARAPWVGRGPSGAGAGGVPRILRVHGVGIASGYRLWGSSMVGLKPHQPEHRTKTRAGLGRSPSTIPEPISVAKPILKVPTLCAPSQLGRPSIMTSGRRGRQGRPRLVGGPLDDPPDGEQIDAPGPDLPRGRARATATSTCGFPASSCETLAEFRPTPTKERLVSQKSRSLDRFVQTLVKVA